jgi:hypothetical protein
MAISAKTAKITMATMEAVPKVLDVEEEVGVAEVVDGGDGDVAAAGAGAILGRVAEKVTYTSRSGVREERHKIYGVRQSSKCYEEALERMLLEQA